MKKEQLMDIFELNGRSTDGFEGAITLISKDTSIIRCKTENIEILHFATEQEKNNEVYLVFNKIIPNNIWTAYGNHAVCINPTIRIKKSGMLSRFGEALTKEVIEKTKTLILLKDMKDKSLDGYYLWSDFTMQTLSSRIKLFGEAISKPSLGRDIVIAEGLSNIKEDVQLVIRTVDGCNKGKVMAVMSSIYKPIPQSIITDAVERLENTTGLGKMETYLWHISHDWTDVYYVLPEKEKELRELYNFPKDMRPCLYMSTSDIGENSLHAKAGWICNGRSFIATGTKGGEVRLRHRGFTKSAKEYLKDFVSEINQKAFPEYEAVPMAMMSLMGVQITPSSLNLNEMKDIEKHREYLKNVFRTIADKANIGNAIQSKKNVRKIADILASELDPTVEYSALDIALSFVDFPSRYKCESRQTKAKLENLVAGVLFLDYEEIIEKVNSGTDEKILLDD